MASVGEQVQISPEDLVNSVAKEDAALGVRRYFTIAGRDPFAEIEWETRDAFIPGKDKPAFEQKGVEFPKFWSQTATNIVAQKYFRGRMASPEREYSVKQMIGRVVTTIGRWGRDGGYFASEDEAQTFEDELKAILVNQLAAFNSPVWFNVGFEEKPQCSACQPYDALVSTPRGMVPIGQLVEEERIGEEICDSNGTTRVVAVKANGLKPVFRVRLRNGGFVGQYEQGTNRSLTIEFQVASDEEYQWVVDNLDAALPQVHRKVRDADTKETHVRRIRLYGEELRDFVDRWELAPRGTQISVPRRLWTASHLEIANYLRSIFQAHGYVSVRRDGSYENCRVGFAVI